MSHNDEILGMAAVLASARIGVLGPGPLSQAMLSQCVLEAYQLREAQSRLCSGISAPGVLQDRLEEIAGAVCAEAQENRLARTLAPPGEPSGSLPRL